MLVRAYLSTSGSAAQIPAKPVVYRQREKASCPDQCEPRPTASTNPAARPSSPSTAATSVSVVQWGSTWDAAYLAIRRFCGPLGREIRPFFQCFNHVSQFSLIGRV